MIRTRATTLVLVNWRGMFYERYQLDEHVTALEGSNGAGKTTVLIGCYVVLLPDMTRLRFTNVGETGSTGGDKGLWGRLGEQGRPSYAVLELGLPGGQRLVAGVQLQRRSEPTVELNPFVITGLSKTTRLQDVLLVRGESDAVPEMNELRESAARYGAHLEAFNTTKDYFARLFDLGITPLRLASDEDRTKFNEMLRTSMTGGISRALTTELRDFLLKEETGLADTLKRMRANLEACRRTRNEVKGSQQLEQEISGIYEAGQEMFAAEIHAIRERAEEFRNKLEEAEHLLRQVEEDQTKLTCEIAEGKAAQMKLQANLLEAKQRVEVARNAVDRLRQAAELLTLMRDHTAQRNAAKTTQEERQAKRERSDEERTRAGRVRDAAQQTWTKAAQGLRNTQDGLEELSRRAGEHRMVVRNLAEVRRLLPEQAIEPDSMTDVLDAAEVNYHAFQAECLASDRRLSNTHAHRSEFSQINVALNRITNEVVEPGAAFDRAREILRKLRDLDACARQQTAFPAEIQQVRQILQRQQEAQNLARTLATSDSPIVSAIDVHKAWTQVANTLNSAQEQHKHIEQLQAATQHALDQIHEQIRILGNKLAAWRQANDRAMPLEQRWGLTLRSRNAIITFRAEINGKLSELRAEHATAKASEDGLHAQIFQLEHSGGTFSPELLKARDTVEGELLAGRFEDLNVSDAALYEALLGPLAQAIAVEDPKAAAAVLARSDSRPDSVWLVGGDASLPLDELGRPPGDLVGRDVLVAGSAGWRLTRLPSQPTLGRRARERRINELRRQQTDVTRQIELLNVSLRETQVVLATADNLLADAELLQGGDPSGDLQLAQDRLLQTETAEARYRVDIVAAQTQINALIPRQNALRDLIQFAWLLDEPDQTVKLETLLHSLAEAKAAATEIQRVSQERELVDQHLDVLRTLPLSDTQIDAMRKHHQTLEERLDSLRLAIQAAQYVQDHRAALDWSDAQAALDKQTALVPALEVQLNQAAAAIQTATEAMKVAELSWDTAVRASNDADAEYILKEKTLAQTQRQWNQLGIDDASEEAIQAAKAQLEAAAFQETSVAEKERQKGEELARLSERTQQIENNLQKMTSARDEANGLWKPAQERWDQLQRSAQEHGVLTSALTPHFAATMAGKGSLNLQTKASESAAVLTERLQNAQDSQGVVESVKQLLGPQDRSGEMYLTAWLQVRDWLRRRIPAQIAEVDEPLEALGRLRDNLKGLETRLAKQEAALRGESADVGKNIEIHIHRAQRQVSRLSDDLKLVRFGSIHGIRLRLERVPHMDNVLQALRDGEAQSVLFKADITIEEALDELFRRYAGRTTGQRLLDYREYVAPKVQVLRQAAVEWEEANPMRMSTGEAIGVGAALMMVVLTAWERDANLLRPRRSQGTLRLLFLDEANRLSHDNLGVLFDLCQNLDLQLMIAAPEVAKAEGNTTYRLVRRVNESGHEEVIVTGRRVTVKEHNADVGSS